MEMDLLEQEEAYRKMNAELELRTRKLMKDVEEVMSKRVEPKLWSDQISYNENRVNSYSRPCRASSCGNLSPQSDDTSDQFDYGLGESRRMTASAKAKRRTITRRTDNQTRIPIDCGDLVPNNGKGMSAESLARFLKAKAKMLQEELAHEKRESARKADDWKKCQHELKDSEENRVKLASELINARDKIKRQEASFIALDDRLSMRDSENAILKKEIDIIRHDLKKINQVSSHNDIKLNKAKEEIEKLKQQLKTSQLNEKEAKEKCRMKEEEMALAVGKLERQKNALLAAIKKQVYLIDNLKSQKNYLELNGITNYCEEEFLKILNWRPGDDN